MIEPSSLVSRMMTFVLAGCLTALLVLIFTLFEMFPLERTEIFFLSSGPRSEQTITIRDFDVNNASIGTYKENFIKEYINARNQIVPDNVAMQRRWRIPGIVYAYSSLDVYSVFKETDFWKAIMEGRFEPLPFKCDVSFAGRPAPRARAPDNKSEKYAVNMKYICRDSRDKNTGHEVQENFTIAVTLAFQDNLDWNERLDNPLGLKVVGYEVEGGKPDPLNATKWLKEGS